MWAGYTDSSHGKATKRHNVSPTGTNNLGFNEARI